MAQENYTCPGCGKLRKAPLGQDIARCRICGTTVEKIEGIWLETEDKVPKKSFNLIGFLVGIICILLGFFLSKPIVSTDWGKAILDQSLLFWGIVSVLITSTATLILGFFIERKHANRILRYSLLFIFAALMRLSFVESSLPLSQSEIYNSSSQKVEISPDSLKAEALYTYEQREDLTMLFFELMTDKYLVDDIDNSSNLNVKKTLDTSENNYEYEITPSKMNERFPDGFRISIRDIVETDLQDQYYEERAGGLGLKISEKANAILIKNEIVKQFEENYELFESISQSDENHWISIKGENYYWIRFLTLEEDFMILEIIRYMNDADARQHKKVMEQVRSTAIASVTPKPLSPQEALACKSSASKLDIKKSQLNELEIRLTYLDFGDPKSDEHIEKEQLYGKQSKDYKLDLKLYESGCESNVSLDFPTYKQVCTPDDLKSNSGSEPFESTGNRFCIRFPDYAEKIK